MFTARQNVLLSFAELALRQGKLTIRVENKTRAASVRRNYYRLRKQLLDLGRPEALLLERLTFQVEGPTLLLKTPEEAQWKLD